MCISAYVTLDLDVLHYSRPTGLGAMQSSDVRWTSLVWLGDYADLSVSGAVNQRQRCVGPRN